MKRRIEHDWRENIKVGDVLLERGNPRVVRDVSFYGGAMAYITLAIKRCSWTHRPYTVINRSEMSNRGFMPTGINVSIDRTELEKMLINDLKDHRVRSLDCCDVKGILS